MSRNPPIRVSRAAFAAMWNNPRVTTDDMARAFGMHRSSVSPTGTAKPQSDRDAKLARYAKIAGQWK